MSRHRPDELDDPRRRGRSQRRQSDGTVVEMIGQCECASCRIVGAPGLWDIEGDPLCLGCILARARTATGDRRRVAQLSEELVAERQRTTRLPAAVRSWSHPVGYVAVVLGASALLAFGGVGASPLYGVLGMGLEALALACLALPCVR